MSGIKKLIVLVDDYLLKIAKDGYGGREFSLSPDHKAVLVLKSGTFSCANCEYVNEEKHECNNKNYFKWKGDKKLPDAPLHLICSDFFSPKKE